MLMAEHSMCQPGRPRPHGESQPTAPSFSSHAFHKAKSPTLSFSYSSWATRAPAFMPALIQAGQTPVVREGINAEIDRPVIGLIGMPFGD
jgi:hypothetical protein